MKLLLKARQYSPTQQQPIVVVVLPVYNPPTDWWKSAYMHCKYLAKAETHYQWQFHFVDDGSTRQHIFPLKKGCYTEGDNLSIFFHGYEQNRGKGYAIRYGLQQISVCAELFMHSDWDFPFGVDLIRSALHKLKTTDVVAADRGHDYLAHLPPLRKKLTQSQRFFNRHILLLKTTDTQAGFKAFNEKGKNMFLKTKVNGFLFDTEFIRLSEHNNLSINTLPAKCRNNLQFKNFSFKVLAKEIFNLFILVKNQ